MTILDEAITRYHRLIETPPYQDLSWARELQEKMAEQHLMPGGRPVCPVVRPHLITRRQYDTMAKSAEMLYAAMQRAERLTLDNPALLSRLELLPAEKMLAGIDPRYPHLAVTTRLDTHLWNGSSRFVECYTDGPAGLAYGDSLADLFYDCPPVKDFRKRYKLSRMHGVKRLLHALLAAYKAAGNKKFPRIAIVEFRPPFHSGPTSEYQLLAEDFRRAGYPTEVVTPDQLEYRNRVLCRGDFGIEIVYRRVSAQEFLVRFDLSHPLLRAYREGAVCMVNSFRAEILQKKALLGLLTDETLTGNFPAAERKAIRDHVPWTRLVGTGKITHQNKTIDLQEYILSNRENLVLKPNDAGTDLHSYRGWETEPAAWERALKSALRSPYVVQERAEASQATFPVYQFGRVESRLMDIDVFPHICLGKVESCSTQIRESGSAFTMLSGQAPTFILEAGTKK